MLSWVEHEKSFITFRPDQDKQNVSPDLDEKSADEKKTCKSSL